MKYRFIFLIVLVMIIAFFSKCGQKTDHSKNDRFTNDSAKVVVDESFRPIVDEELYIFRGII